MKRRKSQCPWTCPACTSFPGDQRGHGHLLRRGGPWEEGGPVAISPGLQRRAAAHQFCLAWLPWSAILHEMAQTSSVEEPRPFQTRKPRDTKNAAGSCFSLSRHSARHLSSGSSTLTQSCPIPPPCQGLQARAVPGPLDSSRASPREYPVFEEHNQDFYPDRFASFYYQGLYHMCPGAGFLGVSQGQLLGLLNVGSPGGMTSRQVISPSSLPRKPSFHNCRTTGERASE